LAPQRTVTSQWVFLSEFDKNGSLASSWGAESLAVLLEFALCQLHRDDARLGLLIFEVKLILGYTPPAAIGLIVPDLTNSCVARLMRGVGVYLPSFDYLLLIADSREGVNRRREFWVHRNQQ
jgi:hypothetical protein